MAARRAGITVFWFATATATTERVRALAKRFELGEPRLVVQDHGRVWGLREKLALARELSCDDLVICCDDLSQQLKTTHLRLLGLASGSSRVRLVDLKGAEQEVRVLPTLGWYLPRLVVASLAGSVLRALVAARAARLRLAVRHTVRRSPPPGSAVAYLRSDLMHDLNAGGSVGHVVGVAEAFVALGHPLHLYTSAAIASVDPAVTPVTVLRYPDAFLDAPSTLPFSVGALFTDAAGRALARRPPALIYHRYGLGHLGAVVLARHRGVPLVLEYNGSEVWIARNWGVPPPGGRLAEDVEEACLRHADLVVVVSDVLRDELLARGVPPERVCCYPNGVDPRRYDPAALAPAAARVRDSLGIRADAPVAGFIGTFSQWHGVEPLAEAMEPLLQAEPDLHLLLIGDGPLFRRVADAAAASPHGERIHLPGLVPQDEARAWLAACDVCLSPHVPNSDGTRFFGSPTKLFEYMGLGRAIVASRLDQIAQILDDGRTALLVEPGDARALTEATLRVVRDGDLRRRLGAAARAEALGRYTWRHNVAAVLSALAAPLPEDEPMSPGLQPRTPRGRLARILELGPRGTLRKLGAMASDRLQARRQRRTTAALHATDPDAELAAALGPDWRERLASALRRPDRPRLVVDPEAVLAGLPEDQRTDLLTRARTTGAGRFDLLGSGPVNLGPSPDWQRDFRSGRSWPADAWYAEVPTVLAPGADIKVPWELSRAQHLPALGLAHHLGEAAAASAYVRFVRSWIEGNPWPRGANWACPMDVAIRAVSWLAPLPWLAGAPELDDGFLADLGRSLFLHGRHVAANPERSGPLTSNHYLADVTGLFVLGCLLPELPDAGAWSAWSAAELRSEILRQLGPDGCGREASTAYHGLVVEMFLVAAVLARRCGVDLGRAYADRLHEALRATRVLLPLAGRAPLLGDDDAGRFLVLGDPDNRRWDRLLAVGALLLEDPALFHPSSAPWPLDARCLFTTAERDAFLDRHPAPPPAAADLSVSLPDGGFHVLRGGGAEVVVSCGPNGQLGNGGHAHNDKLAFEFHVDGRPLVIDPGTFTYTADPAARNRFRATASHATVEVDEDEQNRFLPDSLFNLGNEARARRLLFHESADDVRFVGEHYGYTRLALPLVHGRAFHLDRPGRTLTVHDSLGGTGIHDLRWVFPLDPAVTVEGHGGSFRLSVPGVTATLSAPAAVGDGLVEDATVSPSYGVERLSRRLVFRARLLCPRADLVFRLAW